MIGNIFFFGFLLILFTVRKDFSPPLFILFFIDVIFDRRESNNIQYFIFNILYFFIFFEIDNKKKIYITITIILQIVVLYTIFNFLLLGNASSELHYEVIFKDLIYLIKNVFINEDKFYKSLFLISIIFPLLVPGLFFAKRLTLITILMVLPNIFYDIGGAEKTQFDTHYHSLYFPFLVFTFLAGIVRLESYLKQIKIKKSLIFYPYFLIVLIFYTSINITIDNKIYLKINKVNHLPFYEKTILENLLLQNIINIMKIE